MIENLQIMNDFPAAPKMRSSSVAEFFRALESEDGDQLPTWNGELYLELHRGTYTTQSRNKRANRKCDFPCTMPSSWLLRQPCSIPTLSILMMS